MPKSAFKSKKVRKKYRPKPLLLKRRGAEVQYIAVGSMTAKMNKRTTWLFFAWNGQQTLTFLVVEIPLFMSNKFEFYQATLRNLFSTRSRNLLSTIKYVHKHV